MVEVIDRVFSRVMVTYQRSFALAETLAHIAYLQAAMPPYQSHLDWLERAGH